jgi:hypothetical protein
VGTRGTAVHLRHIEEELARRVAAGLGLGALARCSGDSSSCVENGAFTFNGSADHR